MSQSSALWSGLDFTRKLAEVLGLNDVPIQSITIEASCFEFPVAIIKKTITPEEGDLIEVLMSRYKLMEIESDVATS